MIKDKNNGELVFVPSGGLGNRLRAVASAYHLSQTVGGEGFASTGFRTGHCMPVEGIQAAVAEMFTLARTKCIYGTANSSFSVIASRIGGNELHILEQK